MIQYTKKPVTELTPSDCKYIAVWRGGLVAVADQEYHEKYIHFKDMTIENYALRWIPGETNGTYKLILVPRNDETKEQLLKGKAVFASRSTGIDANWTYQYYTTVKHIRYAHELKVLRLTHSAVGDVNKFKLWQMFPENNEDIGQWVLKTAPCYRGEPHSRLRATYNVLSTYYGLFE